jgi:thiol-disulfide isomerase/thioredoxin
MYIDYSETALNNTEGTKILFFHAPWCPQCREIEASINEDGIPSGVTVFKVDYDSHQSLRNKYGVTLQTTFVEVDDKGNKIDSYVAYEEPRFSSVVRELLRD